MQAHHAAKLWRWARKATVEPQRGIVIRQVHVNGKTVEPSTPVWILDNAAHGVVPVEINNQKHALPQEAVASCPVPRPTIDELRRLDSCFGRPEDQYEVLHTSQDDWFRILRCKEHGRLFLEDTRGGIATYTRQILVEDDQEEFTEIWRRYHCLADDWLNYLGIAL